jgi:Na+/H+ antiporter NhaD/arsenite permease-like protein
VGHHLGKSLPYWLMIPFGGLLLAIAVLPLVAGHWFESNRNRALVAGFFGLPVLAYLVLRFGGEGVELVLHTGEEYVSFIVLLASLYTISGGIYLTGNLLGTPMSNLGFLLVGAVLANLIGTTGAAMVLIRPLLRANSERTHKRHVVIFAVFVICNIGGLLTPLGDPPLFLGFLRGVSFFWTLHLVPQWALAVGLTCAVFLALDFHHYRREPVRAIRADIEDYTPIGLVGRINLLFLLGVIGSVLLSKPLAQAGEALRFPFLRELIMGAMLLCSVRLGPRGPRHANRFTWGPIIEVAIIFAGIFAAMIPALALLQAHGGELGLTRPWHFFWATGVLSSFLDNAPTYLTFTSTAQGYLALDRMEGLTSAVVLPHAGQSPARFLAAISCGAVFMGANSYIGNAPNFMVKSIAEESEVKMPSFFGYMAYSGMVLVPIFAAVTLVFFR